MILERSLDCGNIEQNPGRKLGLGPGICSAGVKKTSAVVRLAYATQV